MSSVPWLDEAMKKKKILKTAEKTADLRIGYIPVSCFFIPEYLHHKITTDLCIGCFPNSTST